MMNDELNPSSELIHHSSFCIHRSAFGYWLKVSGGVAAKIAERLHLALSSYQHLYKEKRKDYEWKSSKWSFKSLRLF
jgi:hypothetical protein